MTTEPKRLIIKRLIEDGGATRESLLEEVGGSKASLATNFTYLRLMGFYPVADEDGVLRLVDEAEWAGVQEARKAERKPAKPTKSPQERYDALGKRATKLATQEFNAEERATADPDNELLDLKYQKFGIERKIANLEMSALLDKFSDEIDVCGEERCNTESETAELA